jgi:hypothetical protein
MKKFITLLLALGLFVSYAQAQIGHNFADVKKHYGEPKVAPLDDKGRKLVNFESGNLLISIWFKTPSSLIPLEIAGKAVRVSVGKKDGTLWTAAESISFFKKEAPHVVNWVFITYDDDHKIWLKGLNVKGEVIYYVSLTPQAVSMWTAADNVN